MSTDATIDITAEVMQSGIGALMIDESRHIDTEHLKIFGETDTFLPVHQRHLERGLAIDDCIFTLEKMTVNNIWAVFICVKIKGGITVDTNIETFRIMISNSLSGIKLDDHFKPEQIALLRSLETRLH